MKRLAILLLISLTAVLRAGEAKPLRHVQGRPNFLFVMIDDMAPDALYNNRFPFLKTPNLDRLAREGAVFDNMMVTTSLCSPSRASILTGTYAHMHGVRYNETQDPDPKLVQYPQALQKVGYKTAQIGKWHMDHHARPRPGFDYWLSFKGQGVYNDPELNENGKVLKEKGYITDILTDKTIEFLKRNNDPSTGSGQAAPFCIQLWHKACHGPFTPAERHKDAAPDGRFEEPASWSIDFRDRPLWQRRIKTHGVHYKKNGWPAKGSRCRTIFVPVSGVRRTRLG
jgi:N-acetylglucosamine-6-sulfatase